MVVYGVAGEKLRRGDFLFLNSRGRVLAIKKRHHPPIGVAIHDAERGEDVLVGVRGTFKVRITPGSEDAP